MQHLLEARCSIHSGCLVNLRIEPGNGSYIDNGCPAHLLERIRDHKNGPEVCRLSKQVSRLFAKEFNN
ncbi:hypothetical protein D3C73_1624500 [compost metagenome]